jgi:hypothetical protein
MDAKSLGDLLDDVASHDRHLLHAFRERYVALARSRIAGIGAIREVVEARGTGYAPPTSVLDRHLRGLVSSLSWLPPVLWEATPAWREPGSRRVDALLPEWRLIVEADGRRWHTRVRDFEYDRWRDNEAAIHGHSVLRFTWHRLTRQLADCRRDLVRFAVNRVDNVAAGSARNEHLKPPRSRV